MFKTLAKSVFGSSNDRYVKSIGKIVDQRHQMPSGRCYVRSRRCPMRN